MGIEKILSVNNVPLKTKDEPSIPTQGEYMEAVENLQGVAEEDLGRRLNPYEISLLYTLNDAPKHENLGRILSVGECFENKHEHAIMSSLYVEVNVSVLEHYFQAVKDEPKFDDFIERAVRVMGIITEDPKTTNMKEVLKQLRSYIKSDFPAFAAEYLSQSPSNSTNVKVL